LRHTKRREQISEFKPQHSEQILLYTLFIQETSTAITEQLPTIHVVSTVNAMLAPKCPTV